MTTTKTVGSGKYTYTMDENWAKIPEGWEMPAAAVFGDSKDRVYCFNRDADHPIVIFDREGNYVSSWGGGEIRFAHSILLDKDDNVWLVDRDHCQVMKFTNDGKLLMTIGTKGFRSDTGADNSVFSSNGYKEVVRGGDPFNLPAGIALNDAGEVFIADGYANARVHKFAPDGTHLLSWGGPGTGAGEFNLPHGVWIDRRGRVLVADRENDRVQVFTQNGEHITTWPTKLIGPALFCVDDEDIVYIPEHNGGFISIWNLDGERLAHWGEEIHRSCHGVWVDSHKDLYVVMPGEWRPRRVVKFTRQG
ncbi:MAG: SMP-30/gluconolactonase/LRE family protein [Chloroflexi bacterium]|nr:SMP-30/gluconolactonase/LRE family protein [Chloroflexota bacterium]MCH8349689.1 SMP-30/gluconolactonase/LRE family protein [Chloroflexota bacterium]MCI0779667.1 SMP-30/gluconolactonase/LRE family protein [Chloroflexota bacterium]MCI0786442.1 SMP-30/gluconolactonase/LRE family protein [Chloroflexota bacterium]MCI0793155.1 SMP-30/gluconolactonase/LRE family protein [Chloroflexota bacterium]